MNLPTFRLPWNHVLITLGLSITCILLQMCKLCPQKVVKPILFFKMWYHISINVRKNRKEYLRMDNPEILKHKLNWTHDLKGRQIKCGTRTKCNAHCEYIILLAVMKWMLTIWPFKFIPWRWFINLLYKL